MLGCVEDVLLVEIRLSLVIGLLIICGVGGYWLEMDFALLLFFSFRDGRRLCFVLSLRISMHRRKYIAEFAFFFERFCCVAVCSINSAIH